MQLESIHFYLNQNSRWHETFIHQMGFIPRSNETTPDTFTQWVQSGEIRFALSTPLSARSPVARYLKDHPSGVADLRFRVNNLDRILPKINPPVSLTETDQHRECQILTPFGMTHTLIETSSPSPVFSALNAPFSQIDHLVLNVGVGQLEATVSWYEEIFGFERQQTFNIATDDSGLYSQVMVHPETGLQFPVNEPTTHNSQIQEFLDLNQGAGIQHIALKTPDLVTTTTQLRKNGLSFLDIPPIYYHHLQQRYPHLALSPSEWNAIAQQQILVDHPSDSSLLLQIFTQPIFEQPTFFFELIERRQQAKGFGEGNFRALFEAIEAQQQQRGTLVNA